MACDVLGRRSWLALVAVGVGWLLLALGVPARWLWILGGTAALVVLAWWIWDQRTADRLLKEMRAFARDHGWELRAYSAGVDHQFSGYPFSAGSRSWREGILEGTYAGRRCGTFTHIVEQQDADGTVVSRLPFQVTFAALDVALPRVDIVPESLPHRLAQALGGVDVEMESHEFNRRWRVICDDRRYAMDVIDPRMMQRLIAVDMPDVPVRIEAGAVVMWFPGRAGVADLSRRLDALVGVANRIPQHVLRRYRDEGRGLGTPAGPPRAARRVDGWVDGGEGLAGPAWATHGGVLNSRRYTGVGADGDADGSASDDARNQ